MTHAAGLQVDTASAAFDDLAESYDDSFTHLPVGRAQRRAVWDTLQSVFRSGNRILELNCGTGEDALFLSRQGVSVVACDASPRMIEVARRRIASENHPSPVEYHVLRTEDLSRLQSTLPFDGVLSNFSGLNCVEDLRAVALGLAPLTKPGAPVCICLSSRFCLWEFFWFILHADVRSAFRRIWGASIARVGGHFCSDLVPHNSRHAPLLFSLVSFAVDKSSGLVHTTLLRSLARDHAPECDSPNGETRPPLRTMADISSGRRPRSPSIREDRAMTASVARSERVAVAAGARHPSERSLILQCPKCRRTLGALGNNPSSVFEPEIQCPGCSLQLGQEQGIWTALPPERLQYYERFLTEYQFIRAAEGRGSSDPRFYLGLPYKDISGRNPRQWAIRSRTFRYIAHKILPELQSRAANQLRLLDSRRWEWLAELSTGASASFPSCCGPIRQQSGRLGRCHPLSCRIVQPISALPGGTRQTSILGFAV